MKKLFLSGSPFFLLHQHTWAYRMSPIFVTYLHNNMNFLLFQNSPGITDQRQCIRHDLYLKKEAYIFYACKTMSVSTSTGRYSKFCNILATSRILGRNILYIASGARVAHLAPAGKRGRVLLHSVYIYLILTYFD